MVPFIGALAFVSFVVIALAVDMALVHLAYLEMSSEADAAAEFGASMIDVDAAHRGTVEVDARRAESAVASIVPGHVSIEELFTTTDAVCVTLGRQHRTVAMAFAGFRSVHVEARSCAEPRAG